MSRVYTGNPDVDGRPLSDVPVDEFVPRAEYDRLRGELAAANTEISRLRPKVNSLVGLVNGCLFTAAAESPETLIRDIATLIAERDEWKRRAEAAELDARAARAAVEKP